MTPGALPSSICCRKLSELEAQLVEEEVAARITEVIEARVAEALASEAVQQSLQQRLEDERRQLEEQVGLAGAVGGSMLRCWGTLWAPGACLRSTLPNPTPRPFTVRQVNAELEAERATAEEAERQRRAAIEAQQAELRKLEEARASSEAAARARQEAEEEQEAARRFQELQAKMREAEARRKLEAAAEKEGRAQKANGAAARPKFSFRLA